MSPQTDWHPREGENHRCPSQLCAMHGSWAAWAVSNLTVPSGTRRLFFHLFPRPRIGHASSRGLDIGCQVRDGTPPTSRGYTGRPNERLRAVGSVPHRLEPENPGSLGAVTAVAVAGSSPDSSVALSTRRASSATTCNPSRQLALALWRVCWVTPMALVRAAGRNPLDGHALVVGGGSREPTPSASS